MLRFLLKRKVIVGLFIVFIFGAGLYGIKNLGKELFPSVTFNQSLIIVEMEEMPAEDVEQFITIPVETILDSMEGIESYESTTSTDSVFVILELESGKADDITRNVENEINNVINNLYGVKNLTVMQASTDGQYEFFMDISNGTLDEMSTFAQHVVKPRLESLKEVNEVRVSGLEQKELIISLKQNKLANLNLTQDDVISTIQQINTNRTIGQFEDEKGNPTLRWNTTFQNLNDIKNIPILTDEGHKTLIELARVEEVRSEQTEVAWKNGDPEFLLLQISRSDGYTQIDMAEAIRAEVKKIKEENQNGIHLNEIAAQADYVSQAIDGVISNILIGGLIAVLVLLLFLRNVRATIIIGLSIPASILLTILTMVWLDYSFNMLSLVGLGLGIGMMVDASIVVLESIFKKKEQGLTHTEAVIKGTREVAGAVISSMLTTIVVFVPIVLLDDEVGKMLIILTVVVAVTLMSSVLIAFTLIPVLSENFLKVKQGKKSRFNIIGKYGRLVEWLTGKKRRRYSVIGLFIVLFLSSFFLLVKLPTNFMPDILDRYAEVVVEIEPGLTADERTHIALKMNEKLAEIPDVETNVILENMGILLALINMTPEKKQTMPQAEVNAKIIDGFKQLEKDYPILSVGAAMDGVVNPPIELRVSGENLNTLQTIGEDVVDKLSEFDYITSADMQVSESSNEYVITLNEKNIDEDGLTTPHLNMYISQLFNQQQIGELLLDDESIPIFIQNDELIGTKKRFLNKKVLTSHGEKKLSHYISLEKADSLLQIDRSDGERYIRILAESDTQDLATIHRDVNELIQTLDIDHGYTVAVMGDLEEQQKAFTDLIIIFIMSLFLVFVVMAIQFNSLKHPLIILFIIPLTLTGVLIGLFVSQKEFNILSAIGVIMLVGIVLNNGILLIDRTRQLRNEGLDVHVAIINSGMERIRPIFMTTLTTVGGMLPLAFATGSSSDYQSPLAVVIISGLLFSTLITLILIPAIYLLFEDVNQLVRRLFKRRDKEKERIEQINKHA